MYFKEVFFSVLMKNLCHAFYILNLKYLYFFSKHLCVPLSFKCLQQIDLKSFFLQNILNFSAFPLEIFKISHVTYSDILCQYSDRSVYCAVFPYSKKKKGLLRQSEKLNESDFIHYLCLHIFDLATFSVHFFKSSSLKKIYILYKNKIVVVIIIFD